jgi:hypothetical protein
MEDTRRGAHRVLERRRLRPAAHPSRPTDRQPKLRTHRRASCARRAAIADSASPLGARLRGDSRVLHPQAEERSCGTPPRATSTVSSPTHCCDDRLSRGHQRRVVRRAAMTIRPIRGIERRQIHRRDRVDHEPRQMIRRQPFPHVRRQQKTLLTATFDEVCGMPGMVLAPADGTLSATASTNLSSTRRAVGETLFARRSGSAARGGRARARLLRSRPSRHAAGAQRHFPDGRPGGATNRPLHAPAASGSTRRSGTAALGSTC